ncbi:hypothetical protein, partial [Serratia marcescens]|uniref:hypothetical protein n=1 Tax=Serratia marcescens TaxID=615 RepID=UPI001CA31581
MVFIAFASRFPESMHDKKSGFSNRVIQVITLDIHTVQGRKMALEAGIAELVQDFIAAGKPS